MLKTTHISDFYLYFLFFYDFTIRIYWYYCTIDYILFFDLPLFTLFSYIKLY